MSTDGDRDHRPFGVRGEMPRSDAETGPEGGSPRGSAADSGDPAATGDGSQHDRPDATSHETGGHVEDPGPADAKSAMQRLTGVQIEETRERIIDQMKTVYDPEIPVNIYDLGMVYEIEVREDGSALVTMTLTSPACPVAGTLPGEVEDKLNEVDGVASGKVDLVWDPPWTPERMSESAKLELGML